MPTNTYAHPTLAELRAKMTPGPWVMPPSPRVETEQTMANAACVAAAPELLAVLDAVAVVYRAAGHHFGSVSNAARQPTDEQVEDLGIAVDAAYAKLGVRP